MCDEITYPFPNCNSAAIFHNECNYLFMLEFKYIHASIRGPRFKAGVVCQNVVLLQYADLYVKYLQ